MDRFKHSSYRRLILPLFFLPFVTIGGGIEGCAPIDQRTFNSTAGIPPKTTPKPSPAIQQKAAFLQIIYGTSENTYAAPVDKAARLALSRKPNVLFTVQGIAPMQNTPSEQTYVLNQLTKNLVVPIANRLVAVGARPIQIDMRANTDSTVHSAMVRVNVQ